MGMSGFKIIMVAVRGAPITVSSVRILPRKPLKSFKSASRPRVSELDVNAFDTAVSLAVRRCDLAVG